MARLVGTPHAIKQSSKGVDYVDKHDPCVGKIQKIKRNTNRIITIPSLSGIWTTKAHKMEQSHTCVPLIHPTQGYPK